MQLSSAVLVWHISMGAGPCACAEACVLLLQVHREHLEWMLGRDIMGRIYISRQGINAQYSGPREDAVAYAEWVAQRAPFEGLYWTAEDVQGHQFPKLRLKVRENLVQLAGGTQQLPICDPEVLHGAKHATFYGPLTLTSIPVLNDPALPILG